MSLGFSIAICAVPFLETLDKEEESLAARVLESGDGPDVVRAMSVTRQRLAQAVDSVVRSLPAVIRNDLQASRQVAYALVGLVDERILHHPAGGLDRWREQLLEFELYGSALAGQEIVSRAQAATYSTMSDDRPGAAGGDTSIFAPLYLALFRAGFEGSLRSDTASLTRLITSLEEIVGASAQLSIEESATEGRPRRMGVPPMFLAIAGLVLWLAGGVAVWLVLPQETLALADRISARIEAGLPGLPGAEGPLDRAIGPSNLPPLDGGLPSGDALEDGDR